MPKRTTTTATEALPPDLAPLHPILDHLPPELRQKGIELLCDPAFKMMLRRPDGGRVCGPAAELASFLVSLPVADATREAAQMAALLTPVLDGRVAWPTPVRYFLRSPAPADQRPGEGDDGFYVRREVTAEEFHRDGPPPDEITAADFFAALASEAGMTFAAGPERVTLADTVAKLFDECRAGLPHDQRQRLGLLLQMAVDLGRAAARHQIEPFRPATRKGRSFRAGQGGKGQKTRHDKRVSQAKAMAAANPRGPTEYKVDYYPRLSGLLSATHGGKWKWSTVAAYLKE